MAFRRIDAFDFFFARPILGSSSCSTLRLVVKALTVARHLEQVLKRPLLIPRVGFLKNNDSGRLFTQLEQYLSTIVNVVQE
jgi:hypothetical protein